MKGLSDLVRVVWAAVSVLSLISSGKVMTQTTVFCWYSLGHWRNRVETTEAKDSPVCRRQREFGNCFAFDPLLKVLFNCFKPCRGFWINKGERRFMLRLKVGYKNGECSSQASVIDQTTLTFLTFASCVGLLHCIYYLQTVSIPKFPPQGHLNTEQEYGFRFCC